MVAHRLTTVKNCKRLAVIDDGKVIEEGETEELSKKVNGAFANLAAGMRKKEQKEKKQKS